MSSRIMSSAQEAKAQLVHAAFRIISGQVGVKLCVCVCFKFLSW